jgi:hypothetical protein
MTSNVVNLSARGACQMVGLESRKHHLKGGIKMHRRSCLLRMTRLGGALLMVSIGLIASENEPISTGHHGRVSGATLLKSTSRKANS